MEVLRNSLFVILLTDCWIFSNGAGCPVGWKGYKSSCYYFSHGLLNWNEAFDQCVALQAYLVEIEDSAENAFLATNGRSYHQYSIGLTDKDTEGTWKWMTSGKPLGFSSWKPGQPDNFANEDCAHFYGTPTGWNDNQCSRLNRYICEKGKTFECLSNPCMNGGTCTEGVNYYTCNCTVGYDGTNCQNDMDECFSNPCMNGGICNDGVNRYTCNCALGYEGKNCQNDINECFTNPCMNGGTCNDGVNHYICNCVDGYEGTDCQNDMNECFSNPCINGGICNDGVNHYLCNCADGYEGRNCANDLNECLSNPCINGGKCHDGVNRYTCNCSFGFEGTNCENEVNECVPNPCLNDGICYDGVNGYRCDSAEGFEGKNCQNESSAVTCTDRASESSAVTCTDRASVPVSLFAVVVSVFVLLITACGVYIIILRRRYNNSLNSPGDHNTATSIDENISIENNCYTTVAQEHRASGGGYEMPQLPVCNK